MFHHSLRTYKCSFGYFLLLYAIQNRQSHRPLVIQCDVTRCVLCISNKVEYLDKEEGHKNSILKSRRYTMNLSDLCNGLHAGTGCIKK